MATQIKPKTSGSFTTIATTTTGLCTKTATGMPSAAGAQHLALMAINQWHNQPTNMTTTARAAKIASAAGLSIQEV